MDSLVVGVDSSSNLMHHYHIDNTQVAGTSGGATHSHPSHPQIRTPYASFEEHSYTDGSIFDHCQTGYHDASFPRGYPEAVTYGGQAQQGSMENPP